MAKWMGITVSVCLLVVLATGARADLIGYWDFDDGAGGTATDKGGANNGTVNGATWVAGQAGYGSALSFNGTSNSVTTGLSLSGMGQFSHAGWIKPNAGGNRVGLWGQNDAIEFGIINAGTIQQWTPGGGGAVNLGGNPLTYPSPDWVHIAVTGDGTAGGVRIYLDGVERVTGGGNTANYGTSGYHLNIGGGGIFDGGGNWYNGLIDDVAVWNQVLTPTQVGLLASKARKPSNLFFDAEYTSVANGNWHTLSTWQGPPPNPPTADSKVTVDGETVTVAAPGAAALLDVTAGGVNANANLTVGTINALPGTSVTLGNNVTLSTAGGGAIESLIVPHGNTSTVSTDAKLKVGALGDPGYPVSPTYTMIKKGTGEMALGAVDADTGSVFRVDGGVLSAKGAAPLGSAGSLVLNGGTFQVTGPPVVVPNQLTYAFYDNAAANNLQNIDDGVSNGTNGGLFALTPSDQSAWPAQVQGKQIWTGEVWQGGNMSDTYCQMWSGQVNVPAGLTGDFTVYVHGDDYEMFWLDVGQDGEFNAGTDDISRNVEGEEGWNTPHTEIVSLVGGQSYDFAIAHREGGGGDFVNVEITPPAFSGIPAFRIDPSDPAQAGLWSSVSLGGIDMTGTGINVTDDSGLRAITDAGPAAFGPLSIQNGKALTTMGADMTFAGLTLAGARGTLAPDNTVTVANYTDGGSAKTLIKAGPGTLLMDNIGGGITAGNTIFQVDAGTLHGTGATLLGGPAGVVLNGGELKVEGPSTTLGAIAHYGYHVNNDGATLDLNNNGGMMGGGDPTTGPSYFGQAPLIDGPDGNGLEFDNDAEFIATGAIGQTNNYSNLWVAMLRVSPENAGDWQFRNGRSDDRAGIWLDLDQDGVFESSTAGLGNDRGEQLRWEWNAPETVTLTPGDYLMAFTHREGGGGSNVDFFVKSPGMAGEEIIKPTSANQFGIWAPIPFGLSPTIQAPGPVDMTGTPVTVTDHSRLTAIAGGGAKFGPVTVQDGASLATGGDTPWISFTQAMLPGGRSVYKPELPTILTGTLGLPTPTAPTTLVAAGTSDLILNRAPVGSVAGLTLEAEKGRMVLDYGSGDPTGGAPLTASGGTFAVKGVYDPNAVVPNALAHYGYHINNDNATLDLHNNGGMMGGGDPTAGPSFFGRSLLTSGPDGNGLEFDNDTEFVNSGAISNQDNYSNLWVGTLHVSAANAGDWQFRQNRSDDRAGIWLDLDQDGVFESSPTGLGNDRGEQLRWENNSAKTVTLAAGDYKMAFTHREGGGGSNVDFFVKSPGMSGEEVINPTAQTQTGLWSATGGTKVDMQNTLTVDNVPVPGALSHLGYHINNDSLALDLNNNAGMMGGGAPTSFQNFYGQTLLVNGPGDRGLDFNDDNDFINSGAVGQNDNYSNLWVGTLHVDSANAGTWGFRNRGDDDRGGIWLDLDQDGIFESASAGLGTNNGEQLSWEDGGWKDVTLAEGDYLIAFTHREGGGGSRADFAFRQTTLTGNAEWVIKPGDAAQAGLWSSLEPASTLQLMADVGNLRDLVLKRGNLAITGGVLFTVENATIPTDTSGKVGLIVDTPTILTNVSGLNGNGQTVEISKSGAADLILNKPGLGLDDATFLAKSGRLIGAAGGGNPFGAAALGIAGGEVVLASAGGDVAFDNPVQVSRDGTLTASAANGAGVAGPLTVTLGSAAHGVTIDPGVSLTMRTADQYALVVPGTVQGGNLSISNGNVNLAGGGTVARMSVGGTVATPGMEVTESLTVGPVTVGVAGGSFGISGNDLANPNGANPRMLALHGGQVTITPPYGTAGVKGLNIWSDDNSNGDGTIDPISNLFGQADLTFEGILGTYDNNDLPDNGNLDIGNYHPDQWAGITNDSSFSFLFEGAVEITAEDDYTFGTASDDGSTLWVDLDRNGLFEHGGAAGDEMVVDNKGAHGRRQRSATIHLTPGAYRIAAGMEERGGGDNMEAKWGQGGGLGYGAMQFWNASGPFWTDTAPGAVNLPDTDIHVEALTTLELVTDQSVVLGDLIVEMENFLPGDPILEILSDATSLEFADLVLLGNGTIATPGEYLLLSWPNGPTLGPEMFDMVDFSDLGQDWYGSLDFSRTGSAGERQVWLTAAVPEPATMLALFAGLAGLGGYVRRRRRKA